MSQNRDHKDYFQKAGMYDLLANYYKYLDPNKHIAYYQKHLKYMNLALQTMRTSMVPEQHVSTQPAKVRFVNASMDASNVDIYVNGIRVLKDFPFKEMSSYLSLPAGKYQIDIYPAGNMVSTILSRKVVINQGKHYTLIFAGGVKNLRWVVLEDNPLVPRGETKVKFIHLSHDAPALDIAVKDRDVIFSNLGFRQHTNYFALSPMTVDFEARIAGSSNIALSIPQVQLEPKNTYTILIVGSSVNEHGLEAIIGK